MLRLLRSSGLWCRRVILSNDSVIPPRSEVDLPTHIVFHSSTAWKSTADWVTEPKSVQPGVYAARTLVSSNRLTDVPIRVMNVNSEPLKIDAGTSLADLQPVEVSATLVVPDNTSTTATSARNGSDEPSFVGDLLKEVDPSLSESFSRTLAGFLCSYEDVFSKSEDDLGLTDIVMHEIDTADARPVKQQLRRYPPAHV